MRVLILDGNRNDRDSAGRYLREAGHDTFVAEDIPSGVSAHERAVPEVIVLDAGLAMPGAIAFLQRLRRTERATRAYVVVVSSKPSSSELVAFIAAGADDYMRKPLNREELTVRVGALDRIRCWAANVFGPASAAPSVAAGIDALRAWKSVDLSISADVAGLIGRSLVPIPFPSESIPTAPAVAALLPLTLASDGVQVRLRVALDAASAARMAELCLGCAESSMEALQDVVRELANTAGGAFMRAASDEGVDLTCGLPADDAHGDAPAHAKASAHQRFVLGLRDGSMNVRFELDIVPRSLRRITLDQLGEGMVLARDLCSGSGALLVPGGTRFTAALIARLSGFLSAQVALDVADAA